MFLSALDPDLLIYDTDHWHTMRDDFLHRIKALAMHQKVILINNLKIAMSDNMEASVHQSFPWSAEFKSIPELRDVRYFVLERLAISSQRVSIEHRSDQISLIPIDATCKYNATPLVLRAWKELLCACAAQEATSEFDVQVATWARPDDLGKPHAISVSIDDLVDPELHTIPLVWDEPSWTARLGVRDFWPDLHECVVSYFASDIGMQQYPSKRASPIQFGWSESFWKSVDDYCAPPMRQLLVKALTKKVYGILDAKLGDEPLGQLRRFRVNYFWRVHYRETEGSMVLESFGPHDMGL